MTTATTKSTIKVVTETLADLLDHLGGIEPGRVRTNPPPGLATEADLVMVNSRKQGICELVDGLLVEKSMGVVESMLAGSILALIRSFVLTRNLGIVTTADGMMRLAPGIVRIPDVAFLSWDRIPGGRVPVTPMSEFAPDLAVEVLSPTNTKAEMSRKRTEYFASGVRLVWEFDPRDRIVTVYTAPEEAMILDDSMALDGGEVLPGFVLSLADLFAELDRVGP